MGKNNYYIFAYYSLTYSPITITHPYMCHDDIKETPSLSETSETINQKDKACHKI